MLNRGENVHPVIAAILSFIIPGLGQAVEGDIKKGVILFVGLLIIGAISAFIFKHWIVTIINVLYRIYAAYDAYMMAQ